MATDYWKKREDDWIEECEKDHEKYLKEIKAIYQRMYDELEEQVELFYQRYAENEGITMQEARKRLTNAEMEKLSRKAKEYCELAALDMRNQNRANEAVYFSEEANAEMAKYNATMRINRLEMLKQYVALSAMKAQANVAGVTREALTEEAMKQHKRLAGILGNTVAGIEGKAKAIAEASFHGQKYSERIWGKNQDELIKRLNKIITDAIIQGKNPDTAIKKMAKDFKVTQGQAKRLVETELQRVKATVYKNQYKESEFDAYDYHAYPKCCSECQKLNGTRHPLKDLEPGYTAPPMHPNCRCSTTPAVDMSFTEKYSDKDVDEFDKWCEYMEKHEDDPNAMTWKEWKERNNSGNVIEKNNLKNEAFNSHIEFKGKSPIKSHKYLSKPKVEYDNIGKIKIGLEEIEKKFGHLRSTKVIYTKERQMHTDEGHPEFGDKKIEVAKRILENPDYIYVDPKHEETVIYVKLDETKSKSFVLRLATEASEEGMLNSIITMFIRKQKTIRKVLSRQTIEIIYSKTDE